MERWRAIETVFEAIGPNDLVLTTTGMISRESFASNDRPGNFYMIGSMGLLSSFGLGLSLLHKDRKIYILDGDGSAMMNMGAMGSIAVAAPANLVHVILDNGAYESTGSQRAISTEFELSEVGRAVGYKRVSLVDSRASLVEALIGAEDNPGPTLICAKVEIDPVEGIPRVSHTPLEIRDRFRGTLVKEA